MNTYVLKDFKIIKLEKNRSSSTFYGYYNTSSFLKHEVLFCEADTPDFNTNLKLFVFDTKEERSSLITTSSAWNWQQGCMLQWLGENVRVIIFNDFDKNNSKFISRIINLDDGKEKRIKQPIYTVAKDGRFALSLNFERLALLRPDYGYFNTNIKYQDLPSDNNDGIWFIDLVNNTSKLIITIETLKNFNFQDTMKEAVHKVNHIDISPNGDRFMFLHRWTGPSGRFSRLLTANTYDGENLFFITGNNLVSHNCWDGDNIISYCDHHLSKPGYIRFKDLTNQYSVIGADYVWRDGHPTFSKGLMLTDEYPDLSRFSKLYIYDEKRKYRKTIGEFYQPLKYTGPYRVDLHPRLSANLEMISIDSAHEGTRKNYLLIKNVPKK